MSCIVISLPIALAYTTSGVMLMLAKDVLEDTAKNKQKNSALKAEIQKEYGDIYDCNEINIINEQTILEKTFPTPFKDEDLLMKTLKERDAADIKKDEFNKITCRSGKYYFTFERKNEKEPFYITVSCTNYDNPENQISSLKDEYTLNVQEKAYMDIVEKLNENNLEIEEETVSNDNTIVLTINLD